MAARKTAVPATVGQTATTSGSRSNRYQPNDGDVGDPAELARLVRDLYTARYVLEDRIKVLEAEVAQLRAAQAGTQITDAALAKIKSELQATGRFPLDLTGLTKTITPPVGKFVVTTTTLTNEDQYGAGAAGVVLKTAPTKDEIWYVKDGNPKKWTKLNL